MFRETWVFIFTKNQFWFDLLTFSEIKTVTWAVTSSLKIQRKIFLIQICSKYVNEQNIEWNCSAIDTNVWIRWDYDHDLICFVKVCSPFQDFGCMLIKIAYNTLSRTDRNLIIRVINCSILYRSITHPTEQST